MWNLVPSIVEIKELKVKSMTHIMQHYSEKDMDTKLLSRKTTSPVPVGYCMIKLVTLNKEHIPEEDQDCYSRVYANRSLQYSAIEITYLAVDVNIQRKRIGTSALELIVSKIRLASRDVPIKYIVINSLVGKISFYEERGFQSLGNRSEDGETQFMYLCIEDHQELDDYIDTMNA